MKRRVDWFLLGLLAATTLAFAYPDAGSHGGALHPELSNKLGVALIFFLNGAGLSLQAFRASTLRWPLHVVIQSATFLAFPLLGLLISVAFAKLVQPELLLGLFFLCALPSTVSSSIALTAAARGDVPSALFNATLSNLLGIFLTPFWVSLRLASAGHGLALGSVVLDLVVWLLLPLFLGQVARRFIGGFVARHRSAVAAVDRGTILLLVYTSFCDSVKSSVWQGHGSSALLLSIGASAALLTLMIALLSAAAKLLGFSREERIAAIFCGSKKTLASGLPMARLMFGANPQLGLIVLPLLVYHPLQLVVGGWLAGRWGREP